MTDEDFLRERAALAWDSIQLAQIEELENVMADYAAHAWRHIMEVTPPRDVPLICVGEEGVVLMVCNSMGEWRTSLGTPHKPPSHWMPCPLPPAALARGAARSADQSRGQGTATGGGAVCLTGGKQQ